METTQTFTKTEAMRRLRACKAVGSKANGCNPRALRGDVGIRVKQAESLHPTPDPEALDAIMNRDDDDLDYFYGYDVNDDCRRHGSIVHLYLYERDTPDGWNGELVDVVTCWLGTPDHAPMVLVPGRKWQQVAA